MNIYSLAFNRFFLGENINLYQSKPETQESDNYLDTAVFQIDLPFVFLICFVLFYSIW